MRKTIQILITISTFIGCIIAILSFINQIKPINPKIEILEISNDNLTNLPKIKNLQSSFYYKDSLITNLWKLNVSVENIGDKTIVGKGQNKNIIDDNLTLKINDGFKLIDFSINKSDIPYEIKNKLNEVDLNFMQWRTNEKIYITIYAEQINNKSEHLKLLLNEREIIDGIVTTRKLNQQILKEKRLIDFLPAPLPIISFWVGVIIYGLILLILPFGLFTEINKVYSFSKWKKQWKVTYDEKINGLVSEGTLHKHFKPQDLPLTVWENAKIPRPDVPTNSIYTTVLTIIVIFILIVIPLLWMIEI